jgi:AraC-like DNA-binding protein
MLHHEMILDFSGRFDIVRGSHNLNNGCSAWLSGLQTSPVTTITNGNHFSAGIIFKPAGLYAITGVDAIQFKEKCIRLEDVFGKEAALLTEQAYLASGNRQIVALLEKFLLKRINGRTIPTTVSNGLHLLQNAPLADGTINTIANRLSVSSKTFIGAFKQYIGTTPAQWHHLLLLNRALKLLTENPRQKLSNTCYELNFTDQAHFIRFFKRYTDLTPSDYLKHIRHKKAGLMGGPNSIELAV